MRQLYVVLLSSPNNTSRASLRGKRLTYLKGHPPRSAKLYLAACMSYHPKGCFPNWFSTTATMNSYSPVAFALN